MPRAPRSCPGADYQCPNVITTGRYCAEHTIAWRGERTASSHVTTTPAWRRLRQIVLKRDGYTCQLQLPGICTGRATVVDKIIPAARRPDLALDPANARASCHPCNDAKARTDDRAASG